MEKSIARKQLQYKKWLQKMIAMQKVFAKSDWRNQLQIARALQKGFEKKLIVS